MTNEQLNALIDNDLRPCAERLRSMRERIESILSRTPSYTDFPDDGVEIQLTRPDAASLPTITNTKLRGFIYLLETVNTTLQAADPEMIEAFCVRGIDIVG